MQVGKQRKRYMGNNTVVISLAFLENNLAWGALSPLCDHDISGT